MARPVVTVASGGLPVVISTIGYGVPVSEAANGIGLAVTQVAAPKAGLPVIYVTAAGPMELERAPVH